MSEQSERATYRRPDGRPKKTGRMLHESIATIRIDDTPADNPRIAIHVEHPDHDGGVRCFFRGRDDDVARSIRRHLHSDLDTELARVEIIDKVGVEIAERDVLTRDMTAGYTATPEPEVTIQHV